jgi:hypothetical protein
MVAKSSRLSSELSHLLGRKAGDEHVRSLPLQSARNGGDFGRLLSLTHDDLGKSLPERSVVIHLGESEVLERKVAQPLYCPRHGYLSFPNSLQELR